MPKICNPLLLIALLLLNAANAGATEYSPRAVAERAAALAQESRRDEVRFAQLRSKLNRVRTAIGDDERPAKDRLLEAALVERPFGTVEGDMIMSPALFLPIAARCGYLRLTQSDLPHLARLALDEQDRLAIQALRRSRGLRAFDVILTLACHEHFEVRRSAEAEAVYLARHRSHRDAAAAFMEASSRTSVHPRWWLAELLMQQSDWRGYEELARFVGRLADRAELHPNGTQGAFAIEERIDTEKVLLHTRYTRYFAPNTSLSEELEKLRTRLQGPAREAADNAMLALEKAEDHQLLWNHYLECGFERWRTPTYWWQWTDADAARLTGILAGQESPAAQALAGRSYLPPEAYSPDARSLLRNQAAALASGDELNRRETVAARAAHLLNYLGDPADIPRLRTWTRQFGAPFLIGLSKAGDDVLPLLEAELSHTEAERRGQARRALVGHFFEGIGPRPWHPEQHQLRIPDDHTTNLRLARILLEPQRLRKDQPFSALALLLRDDLNRAPVRLTDQEYRDLAAALPVKDVPPMGFGRDDGLLVLLEVLDHPAFRPVLEAIVGKMEAQPTGAQDPPDPSMPAGAYARGILEARRRMAEGR